MWQRLQKKRKVISAQLFQSACQQVFTYFQIESFSNLNDDEEA